MFNNIKKILKDPFYSFSYLAGNIYPQYFRKRYIKFSKKNNINSKYFILSFDCDTVKDIEVVSGVHKRLKKIGIKPTYAVPGQLLRLGAEVYLDLKKDGAEFLNHGYLDHTSYNEENRSYTSTLFYDEISNEQVIEDITKGHLNYIDIFGEKPKGFRTPHFGTYQKKYQLDFLYTILNDLKYKFSSSTTPIYGMWKGAIQKGHTGIFEFPVTGAFDYPARILDSWSFRFSPTRKLNENDYLDQFKKIIKFFEDPKTFGIFNIYADPSQVYDWDGFFECMKMTNNLNNKSFIELIDEFNFG